jgi:predicted RNA binding protein YcfA (HicA-like mRNA interferase family)
LNYPSHVWDQLKNKTCDDLISALKNDGWKLDAVCQKEQIYRHPDGRRVSIHYHPQKTYGPKLLKALLEDTGWTVSDFRRLKLIK